MMNALKKYIQLKTILNSERLSLSGYSLNRGEPFQDL